MCSWAVKKLLTHLIIADQWVQHFHTGIFCSFFTHELTAEATTLSHFMSALQRLLIRPVYHTEHKWSTHPDCQSGLDVWMVLMQRRSGCTGRNRTLHRLGLLSLFDYTIHIHSGLMLASKLVQQWLDFLKKQKLCQIGCILQHNTLNLDINQLHL